MRGICFLLSLGLLGGGTLGCADWRILSVDAQPRTLTAGSLEEWYVRVETEPGSRNLEPTLICISSDPPLNELSPDGLGSAWVMLTDSGTWGDTVRGDYVFERRGVHPFLEGSPPGLYHLTFLRSGDAPDFTPGYQWAELDITILPPP